MLFRVLGEKGKWIFICKRVLISITVGDSAYEISDMTGKLSE
ncbi:MAG: hypothetical protein PHE70_08285 [Tepidanaerobacteraceae bacterium]|nr:hypothetical protein [Tepidanaerobacteraceae bacterium]